MKRTSIIGIAGMLMLVLLTSFSAASDLDKAKELVDLYYKYSQEKDVDSFVALHNANFLKDIYGEGYKEYIAAGFELTDIRSYELDYQYYTESEAGLTLFYRIEADVSVDSEKMDMDQDMVALFDKKSGYLVLRYVMLQNIFISKMNQETLAIASMASVVELDGKDLVAQAQEEGKFDINEFYEFVERNEDFSNGSGNSGFSEFLNKFLIFVIVIVLLVFIFKKSGKIKEHSKRLAKKVNHKKHLEKLNPKLKEAKKHAKKISSKVSKEFAVHSKKAKPHAKAFWKKARKVLAIIWKSVVLLSKKIWPFLLAAVIYLKSNVRVGRINSSQKQYDKDLDNAIDRDSDYSSVDLGDSGSDD